MSDPLAGVPIPASRIDPDVLEVMNAAPAKVFWSSLQDKLDAATWEQMKAMARGGIGDVH